MEQESGVLRRSLLSLKQSPFLTVDSDLIAAYKHYILFFDRDPNRDGDCVVFDTQKGTTVILNTGLILRKRNGFSLSYWKDNIFVFYGGEIFGPNRSRRRDVDVHFLYVIENNGQMSFSVESCNLTGEELWDQGHSAHIYQDSMYIFVNGMESSHHYEIVKKFDLNERKWSQCQTTGDIPKRCKDPTTVLFNGKVYFFGVLRHESGLFGQQGGSQLFGGEQSQQQLQNLFVLDLENMKWQQTHNNNFLPKSEFKRFHAEAVGDKIYISNSDFDEFFIYDPVSQKLLKSEGLSPKKNWRIRSFKNHSILFKIYKESDNDFIKYQDLAQEQEKKAELSATQQLSHMELLWKEKSFTDVTFFVENEEIQAHKAILLKCQYFQNMFNSGVIESNSKKINVPDISSTNFKAILKYIYFDKIALTEPLAMELIILADMYSLPNLKEDCANYLSENLTVENFVQVMKIAETADSEKLEKEVLNFLISNIEKVRDEVDSNLIPSQLFIKAIINLKPIKK